jgi:aspartokinase/homoserine dehydrogenase 1
VTIVVNREDSVKALKAVHSRYYLSKTTMAVGIVGPGLIGGTLIEQLREQVLAATLESVTKDCLIKVFV